MVECGDMIGSASYGRNTVGPCETLRKFCATAADVMLLVAAATSHRTAMPESGLGTSKTRRSSDVLCRY
jgi:hypothetical protein